jgi:hypothetical protein
MYKIIGGDGKEYGPISAEQIRQWVAQGRANGQTKVQKEGGDFQPLANHPELAAFLVGAGGASGFRPLTSQAAEVPLPADLLTRDFDLRIGHCLSRGWDLLKANFGVALGVLLLYGLIIFCLSLLGLIPCIGILFSIASMVMGGPLLGGVLFFHIKSSRGQAGGLEDLFAGFKRNFIHLVLAQVVQGILGFIAALPGIALTVTTLVLMGFFTGGIAAIKAFMESSHPSGPMLVAVLAAAAVFFVTVVLPMIYISTRWAFTLALVVDRKMDFWQAMVTSWKVVGKHWWKTFAFIFVTSFINLLGFCCLCLGALVTGPWMIFAYACAYEELFGPRDGAAAPHA